MGNGESDGLLNYIENTGTSTAPKFVQRTGSANPFDGINFGAYVVPAFADLDGDGTLKPRPSIVLLRPYVFVSRAGDLDLVLGAGDGSLTYMENIGTSTAPVFVVRTGGANPFDGIDVGSRSTPALGDFDNDGTLSLRPSID